MFSFLLILANEALPPATPVQINTPGPDNTGFYFGLTALIGAIATAIVTMTVKFRDVRSQNRTDAMNEMQRVIDLYANDISNLKKREMTHSDEIIKLHEQQGACKEENAHLKGEVRLLQSSVQRLQAATGTSPPVAITGGIVVCDMSGNLVSISPALTPHLGWLPKDLRRETIFKLFPERYRPEIQKVFDELTHASAPPWTERVMLAEGVTATAEEVPIAVTLSASQTVGKEWLLTAEIRRRPRTEGVGS